jgi:hypothetical protein
MPIIKYKKHYVSKFIKNHNKVKKVYDSIVIAIIHYAFDPMIQTSYIFIYSFRLFSLYSILFYSFNSFVYQQIDQSEY